MFNFFLFLSIIHGYKIRVTEKAFAPVEIHDKCDPSELTDIDLMKCGMKGVSMECSITSCGEEKFRCDCNDHSYFFDIKFFDITKCRWEREQQESCTTSMTTTTGRVLN